jgi:hypothetical protein
MGHSCEKTIRAYVEPQKGKQMFYAYKSGWASTRIKSMSLARAGIVADASISRNVDVS